MGEYISLLISVLDEENERILKCAIKFKPKPFDPPEIGNTFMSRKNKEYLHDKLPLHVKNCGPIVAVESLFEIEDKTS